MAMRFGGGISGWYWWALSVQVSTLPFPLTGSGSVGPPQLGQVSAGGRIHRPQSRQRGTRSRPSAPPVQKARLASVSLGSSLGIVAVMTADPNQPGP
jgi:hypothetical protein